MELTHFQPGGLTEVRLPLPDEESIEISLTSREDLKAFWHDIFLLSDPTLDYNTTLPYRLHSLYRILKLHLNQSYGVHITNSLLTSLSLLQEIYPISTPLIIGYANFLGITTRDDWKYTHGLFDSATTPSLYELLEYEQKLFDYATQSYTDTGPIQARQDLQKTFNLTIVEAQSLVLTAKGAISAEYNRDDNESRTLMRARIDGFIKRAQDALDVRAEAAALRILTVVDGLSKTTPSNVNTDFREVSARIEKEEEETYIDPPEDTNAELLPPGEGAA